MIIGFVLPNSQSKRIKLPLQLLIYLDVKRFLKYKSIKRCITKSLFFVFYIV